MGKERQLTSGAGAFRDVTDHRTFLDSRGIPLDIYEQEVEDWIAAGAITRGDLVQLTAPANATTPMRVSQRALAAANTAGYLVYGVALQDAAAAGSKVQICVRGVCLVNVGAGTPADTNWASISTATNGLATPTAGAPGATAVLGEYLGRFLGAKNADNRAPLFFEHL